MNDGDRTGGRAALLIRPIEQLSITPRASSISKLETSGYPRIGMYNILVRIRSRRRQPRVTIGDRQQYTQIREGIDDKFTLGDLNITYDFGPAALTSISSHGSQGHGAP